MYKKTLLIFAALVLVGCDSHTMTNTWKDSDYHGSEKYFTTICLDGVEYWIREDYNRSFMSPRIDHATAMPRNCDSQSH